MPPRPKRFRQSPRKPRLYIEEDSKAEPGEKEHDTLTNNTENKHTNSHRSTRKRPMDESEEESMFEMDILAVSKVATEGWAMRWQALMEKHQLPSSNALAEMLINAYDACTCRVQSENTAEPQQGTQADAMTMEMSMPEENSTNPLLSTVAGNSQNQPKTCTFTCAACNKTFPTKPLLRAHLSIHTKNSKTVQGSPFHEKEAVEEEKDTHTDPNSSDQNTTVDSTDTLQTVEKENEAIEDVSEDDEGKKTEIVIKKQSRVARKDDATGEVIGEIVVAGKVETRKIRLKRERNLTCEHCGRAFNTPQLLKFHIRTHTGERPLQCKECGKKFIDHKGLQVHSRVHSGVRPYSCPHCSLTFNQNANLKRHVTSVHDKQKQFLCQYCDARFARLEHLRAHERSHMGIKPFTCIICSQEFATKQHLQRHAVVHTGFLPFSCSKCPRSFSRKDRLLKHEAEHKEEQIIERIKHVQADSQAKDSRLEMKVKGLTCCIMKKEEEEEPALSEDSTQRHILNSIRRVSPAPSPKTTPKIPISRDPSGRRDPIVNDQSLSKLSKTETTLVKHEIHVPSIEDQVSDASQTARLEMIKTPSLSQTTKLAGKANSSSTVATFIQVPETQNTTSSEQAVEYVTYADANESQQAMLDAVLSVASQESSGDQQQHQQQQQQVVYYKQADSGEVVELSPGNYTSVMEPVLYQQEVEVQEEMPQQQVYVVQGAEGDGGEGMIIAESGDMEQGVQYVFQTE